MTGRFRLAASAFGLTLAALTALETGPAAAAPRPQQDCTATSGVIVAVDFAHWGGPVLRSCGSTPTTGYALLNQGGWHTVGTEHDGPGFICRIGYRGYAQDARYPTSAQQSCVQTPPVTAYWASWLAGPGQTTWSYGQNGAMDDHPKPGSVTVWVFGGTDLSGTGGSGKPAFSPQSLRAGRAQVTGLKIVDAPPVTASVSAGVSRGSPWPTVLTVAIAALLAAAAATGAARRRRIEQRS